jgi:hypothetical protein
MPIRHAARAGPAAVPFAAKTASEGARELAALIRLYWQQVDKFNATHHETDEYFDAHAATSFQATL